MKKLFLIAAIAVAGVAAWAASNTNVFSCEDANAGSCETKTDGFDIICHWSIHCYCNSSVNPGLGRCPFHSPFS